MILRPNPSLGVPIYLQLMEQVKHAIETGALRPGEQLPGIRPLAEELVINPNTVAKAYRELEHEGLVEGRRGMGTFITASLATDAARADAPLRQDLDQWMSRAVDEGLSVDEVDAIYTDVRGTHY